MSEEETLKRKYTRPYEERIVALEKENERLRGDLELWESGGCRATNLFECGVVKELKELKEQIEKMKCPWNCRKFGHCKYTNCPCDEWEM